MPSGLFLRRVLYIVQDSLQDPPRYCPEHHCSRNEQRENRFFEKARTGFVFCNLLRMLSAINFDD